MREDLRRQRCFHHAAREAVARCPECRRYFCRECVTEHEGRVLCAACIKRLTASEEERAPVLTAALWLAGACLGVLTAWLFFYAMSECLLALPSAFHEGTVWQVDSWGP